MANPAPGRNDIHRMKFLEILDEYDRMKQRELAWGKEREHLLQEVNQLTGKVAGEELEKSELLKKVSSLEGQLDDGAREQQRLTSFIRNVLKMARQNFENEWLRASEESDNHASVSPRNLLLVNEGDGGVVNGEESGDGHDSHSMNGLDEEGIQREESVGEEQDPLRDVSIKIEAFRNAECGGEDAGGSTGGDEPSAISAHESSLDTSQVLASQGEGLGNAAVLQDFSSNIHGHGMVLNTISTPPPPPLNEDGPKRSGKKAQPTTKKLKKNGNRKGANKRPSDGPKYFMTSYYYFSLDERPNIIRMFPHYVPAQVRDELSERWRNISPESKKKFEALAKTDMDRYQAELEEYNKNKKKKGMKKCKKNSAVSPAQF